MIACVAIGCAPATGYDVVAPSSARGEITRQAGPIITRDGIDYEIFQIEDRIVVRLVNRTGAPLRLTGRSAAFDVAGHAFFADSQQIPPDQAGRVVVPPLAAAEDSGHSPMATQVHVGGIDEGGIIGSRREMEMEEPPERVDRAAARRFRWPVNGEVRLRLIYRLGVDEKELTHEWSFRRK